MASSTHTGSSNAGLEPFNASLETPWNRQRVHHLLRRTHFGIRPALADELLSLSPEAAVDRIVDEALTATSGVPPSWIDEPRLPPDATEEQKAAFAIQNTGRHRTLFSTWLQDMLEGGLRERMTLFWHNHFVTEQLVYIRVQYEYRYLELLREHALGDFKQFVFDIGLTPAMLFYLNGHINHRVAPNENYARELLELFTTGLDHYTEFDIKEVARALTGYRVNSQENTHIFLPDRFDPGLKTILGRTGNFGYQDTIDIIFEERREEIARHICRKLYREFVYNKEDPVIVDELASRFLTEGFELAPVLRTLLKSSHFFDETFFGARLKSPVEFLIALTKDFEIDYENFDLNGSNYFWILRLSTEDLGQHLFNPPDVSGWPGHHDWISAASLTRQWTKAEESVALCRPELLLDAISDPTDAATVAHELSLRLLGVAPDADTLDRYIEVLLDGIPPYEWEPSSSGGRSRVRRYVLYLAQLPEYSLT